MATSSWNPLLSPNLSPSTNGSSHDIWTPFDHLPAHINNPRKRPTLAQLQRLQNVFDASHYITKEERHTLAHEIGLEVKFITVWFQNRRQSDKRKAWTKRDRAKKKENSCQQIDDVLLKPTISLDRVASRKERVQRPTCPEDPRAVQSPQKLRNLVEPQTPTQSKPNTLWAHMPSSPPEAPSSPPSDAFQLLNAPCLVKSGKSLEWACAKARVGSKHRLRKDKKIRPVKTQPLTFHKPPAASIKEPQSNSDDEDQDAETSIPSSSQGQHDAASRTTADSETQPNDLGGKCTEEVEAAMVLLQFLQG